MGRTVRRRLTPVPLKQVKIEDPFWGPRLRANRSATIPHIYRQFQKVGQIEAWSLKRGRTRSGQSWPGFWDSDLAKWIEAAAYSLATNPDPRLERRLDDLIERIAAAQQKDGYLNTYFTTFEPEKRWTNLRDAHELYCAGHLMEAAVAHYEATGTRKLLDVMCRYADYIASVFGTGRGKKRGYPGHEEIELALVRLYRATGETRYLKLAEFFINDRGRQPHYFDTEARARGEDPVRWHGASTLPYDYCQAHLPVREQTAAEGHAVRAMYLYCGMADVAVETRDATLIAPCRRLWKSVTRRRMYVTGGIGSTASGERFTFDYDLPNETAYAETCAAIGLVFWAHRMLQIEDDAEYADVMERALYNGVASGISLDGRRFFYVNPLTLYPPPSRRAPGYLSTTRQEWFSCACCPPNIARLLASLGRYAYSQSDDQLSVHLYLRGSAELAAAGQTVILTQDTDYPWQETVRITVRPESPAKFALALRIPAWCRKPSLEVNGKAVRVSSMLRRGYARLTRTWRPGDRVELTLPMPVERVESHPRVRMNAGRVALQRGPIVYCLEEADNGSALSDIGLPREAELRAVFDESFLGGAVVIKGRGTRRRLSGSGRALYERGRTATEPVTITAVPYSLWCNRAPGEMLVWIREV